MALLAGVVKEAEFCKRFGALGPADRKTVLEQLLRANAALND